MEQQFDDANIETLSTGYDDEYDQELQEQSACDGEDDCDDFSDDGENDWEWSDRVDEQYPGDDGYDVDCAFDHAACTDLPDGELGGLFGAVPEQHAAGACPEMQRRAFANRQTTAQRHVLCRPGHVSRNNQQV